MTAAIPSPHLLNNNLKLVPFLSGDVEMNLIEKEVERPLMHGPYFSNRKICWILAKNSFESILSLFFKCISWFATGLSFIKTGRYFAVLSTQFERDWHQLRIFWEFNNKLLVPAYNAHQMKSWDIFSYGEYPLKKISDPEVSKATFKELNLKSGITQAFEVFYKTLENDPDCKDISIEEKDQAKEYFLKTYRKDPTVAIKNLQNKYSSEKCLQDAIGKLYKLLTQAEKYIEKEAQSVRLYSESGLCRGASLWFIKLLLKSETRSNNLEKRLYAVAEMFRTGVPNQGAILNGLADATHLLKVEKETIEDPISLWDLDNNKANAIRKIKDLSNGVYRVGVYHHSFVFIKTSLETGYVWNPNFGLLFMNGSEMLDMVYRYHYKKNDPESMVYFEKYSLKHLLERHEVA